MTPLEAAKVLADRGVEVADFCGACGLDSHKHYEDCPVPMLPKIVAALEAAGRLIGAVNVVSAQHYGQPFTMADGSPGGEWCAGCYDARFPCDVEAAYRVGAELSKILTTTD